MLSCSQLDSDCELFSIICLLKSSIILAQHDYDIYLTMADCHFDMLVENLDQCIHCTMIVIVIAVTGSFQN